MEQQDTTVESSTETPSTASNLSVTELDINTETKLRGDAIGDTMYSESFVAKTLLRLTDIEWTTELEEDLCFLWDMTVEKDVCLYLCSLSYPSLACQVILKYDEDRLIEIVIGILANIFCADCSKSISHEEINTVLNVLDDADPLILIQVVRFVKALTTYDSSLKFVSEFVIENLCHILTNSLNIELVKIALDALASITTDTKLPVDLVKPQMIIASLEAYGTVKETDEDEFDVTSDIETGFTHLLKIIVNFCTYADLLNDKTNFINGVKQIEHLLVHELNCILKFYSYEENLFPLNDSFIFYIESLSYFAPILDMKYETELFVNVLSIISQLIEHEALDIALFADLICYFISVGEIETIKTDIASFLKQDVFKILESFKKDLEQCGDVKCKQIAEQYLDGDK